MVSTSRQLQTLIVTVAPRTWSFRVSRWSFQFYPRHHCQGTRRTSAVHRESHRRALLDRAHNGGVRRRHYRESDRQPGGRALCSALPCRASPEHVVENITQPRSDHQLLKCTCQTRRNSRRTGRTSFSDFDQLHLTISSGIACRSKQCRLPPELSDEHIECRGDNDGLDQ
jgi:hypothetical protein